MAKTIAERFWQKVGPKTETGCMEWRGWLNNSGYGMLREGAANQGHLLAHRVSYMLHKGEIGDGLVVMHKCDNRKCVNPEHLSVGTQRNNVGDAVAKRRHSWTAVQPRWTKLSDNDISDIRILRAHGMTRSAIAKEYGVSRPLISMLISGRLARVERPLT